MKRHLYFIAALTSLLLCFSGIAHGQSPPPNPKAILGEMVTRYAGFSSYQDSGVIQTIPAESLLAASPAFPSFISVSARSETFVSFKTYYARNRKFRFDWKSPPMSASREAVIWSDGKKVYSWKPDISSNNDQFTFDDEATLSSGVADARRLTSGAIFFVPSLLMKDLVHESFGTMINSMTDLSLAKDEQFNGETCHVISGKIGGTPWALWVGKDSHLLRKTRTIYTSGSFHDMLTKRRVKTYIAEEIHRDIRINEKISEEIFKYKPQLRADDIDLTR